MSDKKSQEIRVAKAQIFECESLPIPPGTKSKARLPRGLEELEEPTSWRTWLIGIGSGLAGLIVGVLIGRFLLP